MFHTNWLNVACVLFVLSTRGGASNSAELISWQYQDNADVMEHRFVSHTTDFIRQWITGTSDVEARVTLFELMELILLPVKIFVKPIVRFLYGHYFLAS